jgi:hypothetical protein
MLLAMPVAAKSPTPVPASTSRVRPVSAVSASASHHHHVTQSSHSINAIGPAPLWSGRKRENCSIMFATITHIPSLVPVHHQAPAATHGKCTNP